MYFLSKINAHLTLMFSFLSKNVPNLTKCAIIAETVTGNIELIPLTSLVGLSVEEGSSVIASNGIAIPSLTQAAVIAENASGNLDLVKTTETVGKTVDDIVSAITKKNS